MISRPNILAVIAMLLLSLPLKSEITTTIIDQAIAVQTNKQAVPGYKGCEQSKLQKVPAYIFELQTKKAKKQGSCKIGNAGKWTTHSKHTSQDNSTLFKNLPDGKYRVICYAGFAIGCDITGDTNGLPNKSIVYEKEVSAIINLNQNTATPDTPEVKSFGSAAFKIFPNPASDEVTIQFENSEMKEKVTVSLVSLLGQVVQSRTYVIDPSISDYNWTIDLSLFTSGSYFIRLSDPYGKSLQEKLVLLKKD